MLRISNHLKRPLSQLVALCILLAGMGPLVATDYYLDAEGGSDSNTGTSIDQAWASLTKASEHSIGPGDRLLLKRGQTFNGKLALRFKKGLAEAPIRVEPYGEGTTKPVIDGTGENAALDLGYSEFIEVEGLELTGMGVLVASWMGSSTELTTFEHYRLKDLYIHDTGSHGIHFIVTNEGKERYKDILIEDCLFENIGNFGININKWAGDNPPNEVFHEDIQILNNTLRTIGDAGIQVGKLKQVLVQGNTVSNPGGLANGNGSGMWTWYCHDLIAEKNVFMHARGDTDACGLHVDIGNVNNIVQYNLSIDNEGGFVEILGKSSNCVYRYNISVNDGARIKGQNGALQHGKTFWLGGYTGMGRPKEGPYNSYIYNNTIYVDASMRSNYFMEPTAEGALLANNIIYVAGDAASLTNGAVGTAIIFDNNLIYDSKVPEGPCNTFTNNVFGDPQYNNAGGLEAADYQPLSHALIVDKGIDLYLIPGDSDGVLGGFAVSEDFFGDPVVGAPDMGAIEIYGLETWLSQHGFAANTDPSLDFNKDGLRIIQLCQESHQNGLES